MFKRQGKPEKITKIVNTTNSKKSASAKDIFCKICGNKIGSKEGDLFIVLGKTFVKLEEFVCDSCKK